MKLYSIYENNILIYEDLDEMTKDDFMEHLGKGKNWQVLVSSECIQ